MRQMNTETFRNIGLTALLFTAGCGRDATPTPRAESAPFHITVRLCADGLFGNPNRSCGDSTDVPVTNVDILARIPSQQIGVSGETDQDGQATFTLPANIEEYPRVSFDIPTHVTLEFNNGLQVELCTDSPPPDPIKTGIDSATFNFLYRVCPEGSTL